MTAGAPPRRTPAEIVFAYHARTKHGLERYAAGPETLDWDAQPDPFRTFADCPRVRLPLGAAGLQTGFADLSRPGAVAPAPLALESLGALLQLSLGLSAWKELGPDRWALRCNPSSGNLHPTEAYVLARGVAGLADGVHHYVSRDHALELRRAEAPAAGAAPFLGIGLSSIHWREAWKYGERAFRYCQLDVGHALGALRYAAAVLGWSAQVVEGLGHAALAAALGLDREADFAGVEPEEPELVLSVAAGGEPASRLPDFEGPWRGRASLLDPHPLYRWPVIDEAAQASRGAPPAAGARTRPAPPLAPRAQPRAAEILLGRRSAQRFDRRHLMPRADFLHMADRLLPRAGAPWDAWGAEPRIHPILWVHGVEGLQPGIYALPRRPEAEAALRAELQPDFLWRKLDAAPDHLPLFQLHAGDVRAVSRTLNCRQAIGGDACFALSLLGEFEPLVAAEPWRYRRLHWEAGLLGQVLYLEAEAAGLRGTGIGCFFDDALHELIGLRGWRFQTIYHFTVGLPLADARITTRPPYPAPESQPPEIRPREIQP